MPQNFHKSSQASPIFGVIQISAAIAGFAPSVIAMAVTTAVQVAAQVGAEIHARQRTNTFLDKMNEELFKPKGLFAFIMKYKPESEMNQSGGLAARFGMTSQVVDMSTNQIIAKYNRTNPGEDASARGISDKLKGIRLASGTTQGAIQLPEAAPLIFPEIDYAMAQNGAEETFKDKAKDFKKFLGNYMDRRAQIQYARDDPNSNLAVPEEHRSFKSKWADPRTYDGGIGGIVSGGGADYKADRRFEKDSRRVMKYEDRMDRGRELSGKKQARYDAYMAEVGRRGMDPYGGRLGGLAGRAGGYGGGYDDYDSGYGGRRGMGGGRRRGGGLISGLIGAAVNAAQYDGNNQNQNNNTPSNPPGAYGTAAPAAPYGAQSNRSGEYEDAYLRDRQYGGDEYGNDYDPRRRSFDDRQVDRQNRNYYGPQSGPQQLYDGGRRGRGRRGGGGRQGGAISSVKRLMREDVLYLMIVNMPSEEELAEARRMLGVRS
jgi:hypothetical protein